MIKHTVIKIISDQSNIPINEIRISTSLQEDLMLEASKVNDIINEIERHFKISIPIQALDELYSVYDIIQYVKKHGNSGTL